jgi:formylglycine-generating enzyme required for sulfatase activity
VTADRYARFLDSLPPEEARARVPRVGGILGGADRPLWTERNGRFVPPPGASRRPIEGISPHDARAFARFEGKRLPTAAEWAWAATGPDRRATPLGALEDLLPGDAVLGPEGRGPADAGATPADRSPFGLLDMAGNLSEITGSRRARGNPAGWLVLGGGYATDAGRAWVLSAAAEPGWRPLQGAGTRLVRDGPP